MGIEGGAGEGRGGVKNWVQEGRKEVRKGKEGGQRKVNKGGRIPNISISSLVKTFNTFEFIFAINKWSSYTQVRIRPLSKHSLPQATTSPLFSSSFW